jgi:dienelactone hydrolase
VHVADIEYTFDGLNLVGEIAVDDTRAGSRPAVLIAHDGGGLDDHPKRTAHRLAELGYVAFALDYYGGGARLPADQVGTRFGELASDSLRTTAIGQAGLDVLLANEYVDSSKVAAIGYCFGGTMALEMARAGTDLQAVVGFHSGLATNYPIDSATNIKAKILVCIGSDDPIVPADQRTAFEKEMSSAGVDWQLHLYGGAVHSFTKPEADGSNPAIKYHEDATRRSWQSMLELFTEVF